MKKKFAAFFLLLIIASLFFSACDGPNSASWTMVSNNREQTLNQGFSISVGSARSGTRNRTFNLNDSQLSNLFVESTIESGSLVLTISQNGELDGSEVVIDLSGNFEGHIDTSSLSAGNIRLSFRYEDNVRNSNTIVTWRE